MLLIFVFRDSTQPTISAITFGGSFADRTIELNNTQKPFNAVPSNLDRDYLVALVWLLFHAELTLLVD